MQHTYLLASKVRFIVQMVLWVVFPFHFVFCLANNAQLSSSITTDCTDVCVSNNSNGSIALFVWHQYNISRQTNIYHCDSCTHDMYLYGWIEANTGQYTWRMGGDPNTIHLSQIVCTIGLHLGHMYAFDVDHCTEYSPHIAVFRTCNHTAIPQSHSIEKSYTKSAVGFDVRTLKPRNNGTITVQYLCDNSRDLFEKLTDIRYSSQHIRVLYTLPSDCDGTSSVTIRLKARQSILNVIHLKNVYLFTNLSNILYFDDMNMIQHNWTKSSSTTIGRDLPNESCPSDGVCYVMHSTSYIAKAISLNSTLFLHKDLNLEWWLTTNGLSDDSSLTIETQCGRTDAHVLYEYRKTNDCVHYTCAKQSIALPSICDLSTTLFLRFYLQSSHIGKDIVFIDYVKLTHSTTHKTTSTIENSLRLKHSRALLTSGEPTTEPTLEPTFEPIFEPTLEPTLQPTFKSTIPPSKQEITVINDEIWFDDFAYDVNRVTGWTIYEADAYGVTDAYYYTPDPNPLITGDKNQTYHGPFYKSVIGYTWVQRYFKCAAFSDVYVYYSFAFCETDSSDKIRVYMLNQTSDTNYASQAHQRSDIGNVVSDYTFLSQGKTLCNTTLSTATATPWKYKEKQAGVKVNDAPVTHQDVWLLSFRQTTDKNDEFSVLYDIKVQCRATTKSPTKQSLTTQPTTFAPSKPPLGINETHSPTEDPTHIPTGNPTITPTKHPTLVTLSPTQNPTLSPVLMTYDEVIHDAVGKTFAISCGTECNVIAISQAMYGQFCYDDTINLQSECDNKTTCDYEIDVPSNCSSIHPASYRYQYLCISKCESFVDYDPLHTLSEWTSTGDVSTVFSSKCPSLTNYTAKYEGNKICISNSNQSFWDGQYEWQYYDENINGSIYYNTKSHTFIYEYRATNHYTYYMNDYQHNRITMTRCIAPNVMNIRDCNSHWEDYYNHTWHTDPDMIATACNDICMYGHDIIQSRAVLVWSYYNDSIGSNVYHCEDCTYTENIVLHGAKSNNVYHWRITFNSTVFDTCFVAGDIFDINNCFGIGKWDSDSDLTLSSCEPNPNYALFTLSSLPVFQESQICVEHSNVSLLDGVYKWLYFDYVVGASIYYNAHNNLYIQPHQVGTYFNSYEFHIYGHIDNTSTIHAKCSIQTNISSFEYFECIDKWQIYDEKDDIWYLDSNMISTPCQQLCIRSNNIQAIGVGLDIVVAIYLHFDSMRRSNVYYCPLCQGGGYLFGKRITGEWAMYEGYDQETDCNALNNKCGQMAGHCDIGTISNNDYIFNINDCSGPNSWLTFGVPDPDTIIYKCNPVPAADCVEVQANAAMHRTYHVDKGFKNLAIGFDVNIAHLSVSSVFMVQYHCSNSGIDSGDTFHTLTTFDYYDMDDSIMNFVYKLPFDSCDEARFVSIQFMLNGVVSVYLDNVYLYYNMNAQLYYDEMDSTSEWLEDSDTANRNYVSITKTIDIGHKYHDLKVEWSLISDGLSDGTILDIKYQCSNNYLYVYDLCILKQYDSTNDCADHFDSCHIQSYNLPSECDLSSQIVIQFYLQSTSDELDMTKINIDYLSLTHSDASGDTAPLCRTASPTVSPTLFTTEDIYDEDPSLQDRFFNFSEQYILIISGGFICILATFSVMIYACVKAYFVKKYKNEMLIHNAMVIVITIAKYDHSPHHPDAALKQSILQDLILDLDVRNVQYLFGPECLSYDIFPTYDTENEFKFHWKRKEIIRLLTAKAFDLDSNLKQEDEGEKGKYDGLVVVISSHGMKDSICTSDYQLLNKVEIHRIFSKISVASRDIPRLFLFDCCDGGNRQTYAEEPESDDGETTKQGTVLHEETPILHGADGADHKEKDEVQIITPSDTEMWLHGQKNPDHKLAVVHAANAGFQAMVNTETGSYLVGKFVRKTVDAMRRNNEECVYEIFDQISTELETQGKQKIVATYLDQTRFIKFQKNKNKRVIEVGDVADNENAVGNVSDDVEEEIEMIAPLIDSV
eukprot:731102_1